MHLNFAKYIGGMRSYMPSPAFGGRYALDIAHIKENSRSHVGEGPLHLPSDRQVSVRGPLSASPKP